MSRVPQRSLASIVTSPRVWLLFAMGFTSGLPLYLVGGTLSAWMTKEEVSLKTIGFFSWVGTAYIFKFLWAPLLDRYALPFLGRRRGWILVTQVLVAAGLVGMANVRPAENLWLMAAIAVAVAFAAASQDIVLDAYRTDLLTVEERAFGVGVNMVGYRVGLVTAMSFALLIADATSWRTAYLVMAACMGVGIVTTLLAPEPHVERTPRTLFAAVVLPFRDFFSRGWPAFVTMGFILLFRVGDAVAAKMTTPYVLRELHFTLTEVGTYQKFGGMAGAIAGAILGGLLINRLGLKTSLLLFGAFQASTNLLYIALGLYPSQGFLLFAVASDNFAGGMGSAAITVFLTALCNKNFSATQYALLSSLAAVPMHLVGGVSGVMVEAMGWPRFFVVTALAMGPALLLLLLLPRDLAVPPTAGATPPVDSPLLPAAPAANPDGHGPAVGGGRERTTS